jgi:hypothetical protein
MLITWGVLLFLLFRGARRIPRRYRMPVAVALGVIGFYLLYNEEYVLNFHQQITRDHRHEAWFAQGVICLIAAVHIARKRDPLPAPPNEESSGGEAPTP